MFILNIIVQGLIKASEFDDAVVYFEEMDKRGFSLQVSTFAFLLALFRDSGNDPSLFKIVEKFAPKMCNNSLNVGERGSYT